MKKEPQKQLCPQAYYCWLFKRLIRDTVKILVSWKPCTHYGNMILISKTCVLDWFSRLCPVTKYINEDLDKVPRYCTATANCSSEEEGPNAENKFHYTLFFFFFFIFILLLCWVFTEKWRFDLWNKWVHCASCHPQVTTKDITVETIVRKNKELCRWRRKERLRRRARESEGKYE